MASSVDSRNWEDRSRPPETGVISSRIRVFLGPWLSHVNPEVAHDAVLRLTYGAAMAVVTLAFVVRAIGLPVSGWILGGLGAAMIVETRLQQMVIRRRRFRPWMPLVHLAVGLVLLAVGIHHTGGIRSPFVWVFGVAIAVEGVLRGPWWAFLAAMMCTFFLLITALITPAGSGQLFRAAPPWLVRALLLSYIGMFFVVAGVTVTLRRQVQEVLRLAFTDPLTGLGNRYALRQAIEREVARSGRYGMACSVIVVEVDRFKRFNDRYGHLQGDEALRRVAALLRESSRGPDFPTRFGGDEFIVLLPQTDKHSAARVAERMRAHIEEFSLVGGYGLTASFGLATFPDDATIPHDLIESADRAAYRAKARGGNAVEITSPVHGVRQAT